MLFACIHTLRIPFHSQYWSRAHKEPTHDELSNERVSLTISITICNSVFSIPISPFFSLPLQFFSIEEAPVFFTAMNLKLLFLNQQMHFLSFYFSLQFFWLHKTKQKKMAITLHKLLLSNKLKNDAQSTNLRLKMYHICTRKIEKKMWIRRDKEKRVIIIKIKTTHTFVYNFFTALCSGCIFYKSKRKKNIFGMKCGRGGGEIWEGNHQKRGIELKKIYIYHEWWCTHNLSNLIIILFLLASVVFFFFLFFVEL